MGAGGQGVATDVASTRVAKRRVPVSLNSCSPRHPRSGPHQIGTLICSGLTNSGKSTSSRHFTTQLLHLASPTKDHARLSDQIAYISTILDSFGNAKTPLNPSASLHARYTELHFDLDGSITGAKVLPFGLQKSRVNRLRHDERTFHIFYQLLAGASPDEVDALQLEEPGAYALLSSSGCYRLPGGPFSDDAAQMGDLRAGLASLGLKAKHVRSILTVLTAVLVLSNLTFADNRGEGSLGMSSHDEHAWIEDTAILTHAAGLLGVAPEQLESVLVNRTRWIKKDLLSSMLDSTGAVHQRDSLMRDLYGILFTFVVEMINKRLAAPSEHPPHLQVIQLELPGFTSRTITDAPANRASMHTAPLINAGGENGLDEFCTNFMNELLHSYLLSRAFDDDVLPAAGAMADGLRLPSVTIIGNSACVELLRGGLYTSGRLVTEPIGVIGLLSRASEDLKGEEDESDRVLESLTSSFGRHASFSTNPTLGAGPLPTGRMFGITHYAASVTYDATDFVERAADVMDKQLVDLLINSTDPFIARLVSGPGLASEGHPMDEDVTVEDQVSVSPLRKPTPVVNPLITSPGITLPGRTSMEAVDTSVPTAVPKQLNATLSAMLNHMDATRLWTVHCIRPNDSGHPNSFYKRRVKAQIGSLLLEDLLNRRQVEYTADYPLSEFTERHNLRSGAESIQAFAAAREWSPNEYKLGRERIWLSWKIWRDQEDILRAAERHVSEPSLVEEQEELKDSASLAPPSAYDTPGGESTEHLLRPTSAADYAAHYRDTSWSETGTPLDRGLDTPMQDTGPFADTEETPAMRPNEKSIQEEERLVVRKKETREELPVTRSRRWWLRLTWVLTWWIPSFTLRWAGMKRADVRMAWREKVAIFMIVSSALQLGASGS